MISAACGRRRSSWQLLMAATSLVLLLEPAKAAPMGEQQDYQQQADTGSDQGQRMMEPILLSPSNYNLTAANQIGGQPSELSNQLPSDSFGGQEVGSSLNGNLQRYLWAELDSRGMVMAKPADARRKLRVRQILESLSGQPATPLYRAGRALYSAERRSGQLLAGPDLVWSSGGGARFSARARPADEQPLEGLEWVAQGAEPAAALVTVRRSQPPQRHSRARGAEISPLGPALGLSGDYEFKRQENSRWNNLRGMWGKRAAAAPLPGVMGPPE